MVPTDLKAHAHWTTAHLYRLVAGHILVVREYGRDAGGHADTGTLSCQTDSGKYGQVYNRLAENPS